MLITGGLTSADWSDELGEIPIDLSVVESGRAGTTVQGSISPKDHKSRGKALSFNLENALKPGRFFAF